MGHAPGTLFLVNVKAPGQWRIRATRWEDPAAVRLRADMDAEISPRYAPRRAELGPDAARALAVDPDTIVATLLVTDAEGTALGHGALRRLAGELEIKRVFVSPAARGRGASSVLMQGLEDAAAAQGGARVILQTGDRQPEAVTLYERRGYTRIPIYPPYTAVPFSLCFEKRLAQGPAAWKDGSVV